MPLPPNTATVSQAAFDARNTDLMVQHAKGVISSTDLVGKMADSFVAQHGHNFLLKDLQHVLAFEFSGVAMVPPEDRAPSYKTPESQLSRDIHAQGAWVLPDLRVVSCPKHDRDAIADALGDSELGKLIGVNSRALQQELNANRELELEGDERLEDYDTDTRDRRDAGLLKLMYEHGCVRVEVAHTNRHRQLVLTGAAMTHVAAVEPMLRETVSRLTKPARLEPHTGPERSQARGSDVSLSS